MFAPGAVGGKWVLIKIRGMPGGTRSRTRSVQRRGFESAGAKPPRDGGGACEAKDNKRLIKRIKRIRAG
jgi:hypothetical protein